MSCTLPLPSLAAAAEVILDCRAVSLTSRFRYHLSPFCSTMRTWCLRVSLSPAILSGTTLQRNLSTVSQSLVPITTSSLRKFSSRGLLSVGYPGGAISNTLAILARNPSSCRPAALHGLTWHQSLGRSVSPSRVAASADIRDTGMFHACTAVSHTVSVICRPLHTRNFHVDRLTLSGSSVTAR